MPIPVMVQNLLNDFSLESIGLTSTGAVLECLFFVANHIPSLILRSTSSTINNTVIPAQKFKAPPSDENNSSNEGKNAVWRTKKKS